MSDAVARKLYESGQSVRPAWSQLGDVTRSVWLEYAARYIAGIKDWWAAPHESIPHLRGSEAINRNGVIMELDTNKVADQLDEVAALLIALSGTFRAAGGGGATAGGKSTAGGKPAGKPPAKVAAGADEGAAELTEDDVREALKELVAAKGKDVMVSALESVGAAKLGDVDESQYQELMDKIEELKAEEEAEPTKPAKKVAAKKAAKKAGLTLEDVTAAASALIDADKPAYMKLMKKLGKPSDMDEANYAAAIAAYEAAMPDNDDEEALL